MIVHAASSSNMSFTERNFKYQKMKFGLFLRNVFSDTEKLYLRATSNENSRKYPASLTVDFPTIEKDFELPGFNVNNAFSTVLRIGSKNTNLWLHYDVCNLIYTTSLVLIWGRLWQTSW